MKQKGFTLIELLIVVVILGILSAALYPKFSWYLARTRDLQRKMDLTYLASAIQVYKDQTWFFPSRGDPASRGNYWWSMEATKWCYNKAFFDVLKPYLIKSPSDPQKNSKIKIHHQMVHKIWYYANYWGKDRQWWCAWKPWQYLYQMMKRWPTWRFWAAVLVAKMETSDSANYVLYSDKATLLGGLWPIYVYRVENWILKWSYWPDINDLKLCASVEKSDIAKWELQPDGTYTCFYTDEEQLYYILKIE